MRRRLRTRWIAAGLAIAATAAGADPAVPSFKHDIQPIFNAQCVFCHVTGAENGGLNLGGRKAYASLMAHSSESPLARVQPGDPAKSYLIHKLSGTQLNVGGSGYQMPFKDPPTPIDPAQLTLIKAWIQAGAPNN